MNIYLSEKIKTISFFAMISVVYIHSYNFELIMDSQLNMVTTTKGYSTFIQLFLSFGLTRIAVPFFFIFSGFLFFLNVNGSNSEFLSKIKKRFKTLLVPFLLWSSWGLLFYLILQSIPQFTNFFTNKLVINYSLTEWLSTLFINPIAPQLWFLRDLFVLILLSPLIYFLVKKLNYFILLLLLIPWLFKINLMVSNEAVLFFTFGAFLSTYKKTVIYVDFSKNALIFFIAWLILVLIKTILQYQNFEYHLITNLIHKLSIIIGIVAIWCMYDKYKHIFVFKNKYIILLTTLSFFLFAFHEPFLTVYKKLLLFGFGKNGWASITTYFLAPIFTIINGVFVASILKKYLSSFYALLNGGR